MRITHDLRLPPVDVVLLFVDSIADLERRVGDILERMHPAGGFWVAYRASGRGTDVTEDIVRRVALAAGMVDNKVCAIDGCWAGVRLVLRNEIRDAMMYRCEPPLLSRRVRRPTAPARRVRARTSTANGAGSSLRRASARSTK